MFGFVKYGCFYVLLICRVSAFVPRVGRMLLKVSVVNKAVTKSTLFSTPEEHTEQFKLWEVEEIEKQNLEEQFRRQEDNEDDELPEYMLRMLSLHQDTSEVAVPEGKLPIIAVIGRPNTGKSTIVNKLTNCYKVIGILLHFFVW